jgi:nitrite reductase (NADH) large subunit
MVTHVTGYVDEWRATLEDPEKLRRFVSFVNAPDRPDPSLAYVVERGQPRPAGPADRGAGREAVLIAGPRLEVTPR